MTAQNAKLTVGVVPIARNTFDVPLAEAMAAEAFQTLDALGVTLVGPRTLLFDADGVMAAIEQMKAAKPDLVIVMQVTFADASMTVALAEAVPSPLLLWAFPEDRTGGRLRLNAFCGINLAGHALGKVGRPYGYLFAKPGDTSAFDNLDRIIAGCQALPIDAAAAPGPVEPHAMAQATAALEKVRGQKLGVIGEHPVGFDTCAYDPGDLQTLMGVEARRYSLDTVFENAKAQPEHAVQTARARVDRELAGANAVEAEPLEKSLRVYGALKALAAQEGLSGMAVRCWPEFFTDYGCAACGAMGMLNQDGTPCACEADVYGNATTLLLQALVEEPVFVADLVDLDDRDGTGVLWHCGLAPLSMADPKDKPEAALHSNRQKPLLSAFALKPGRITIARLSQARGETKLVIGGGEVVRAPRSFSGTSGVIRFDRPVAAVLDTVMGQGLEHHYCFAYGDVREALTAAADRLGLKILAL